MEPNDDAKDATSNANGKPTKSLAEIYRETRQAKLDEKKASRDEKGPLKIRVATYAGEHPGKAALKAAGAAGLVFIGGAIAFDACTPDQVEIVNEQGVGSAPTTPNTPPLITEELRDEIADIILECDELGNLKLADDPRNEATPYTMEELRAIGTECVSTPGEDTFFITDEGHVAETKGGYIEFGG